MSTPYPPHYAYPSAPPLARVLPKPPRMHWAWVLLLCFLTLGLFSSVWLLVQANWIRKMRMGKSTGFWLALANLLWLPVLFVAAIAIGIASAAAHAGGAPGLIEPLSSAMRMGSFILYLATVYVMRSEMETEPIGLSLGGVMTFFFGVFYFQYHLSEYGHAYRADGGLGIATPYAPHTPDPAEVAYPTAAQVGVAYPPAREPMRLPPEG